VRLVARVLAADGTPLKRAVVDIVVPQGDGITSIGRGKVTRGALTVSAEPGPVWGLLIDTRPVLTFPIKIKDDTIDLGAITLLEQAVPGAAFHAPDGQVFALSAFAVAQTPLPEAPATRAAAATDPRAAVALKPGLTFGGLVGSTAQQLSAMTERESLFQLAGASVKLRGVPTISNDAIGLEFPNADLAASGVGMSELAFTLTPPAAPPPAPTPSGLTAPDLTGYTRDFAARKLATLGLLGDISVVIVAEPSQEGRVVRQVPKAGSTITPGMVVRLFVGQRRGP
jgi:hypothetical protein